MARTPSLDNRGLKKGSWTPDEDRKLVAYITRYGCWNWRQLPRFAGLARCGKSCRLRWLNYLRPDIKRGNYTPQEEDTIVRLHHKLGSKWSVIASNLPGRTDNDIKNHWHSTLKKRFQRVTADENNESGGGANQGLQVAGSGPVEVSESSSTTHYDHQSTNGATHDQNLAIEEGVENGNMRSERDSSCWVVESGEYANGQFASVEPPWTAVLDGLWGWQQYGVADDVAHYPNQLFAPFDHDFFGPSLSSQAEDWPDYYFGGLF